MTRPENRWRTGGVAVLAFGLLAACGGGAKDPTPLHAAPEPAMAPVPTTTPAGTVVSLAGSSPEGAAYDPGSGLVVFGIRKPDRLVVVDPTTDAVRYLPVDGSARHLEIAAPGTVLVPGEDTNQVLSVALPSGRVTATVQVGKQPHDVAVVGPTDWYVADEFGPNVEHVLGGKVVRTFGGKLQPGGAGVAADTGAVVDVRSRLVWFYRGGKQIAKLDAGAGPTHAIGVGGGQIVVTDTTGDALLRYDVAGKPKVLGTVHLPASSKPYGTAYDPNRKELWITATGTNLLLRYAVTSSGLRQTGQYPTVQDAYAVTVDPTSGKVFLAGEKQAQLQIITP